MVQQSCFQKVWNITLLLDDTLILPLDDAIALLMIDGRPTKDAFEGEQAYFDLNFF